MLGPETRKEFFLLRSLQESPPNGKRKRSSSDHSADHSDGQRRRTEASPGTPPHPDAGSGLALLSGRGTRGTPDISGMLDRPPCHAAAAERKTSELAASKPPALAVVALDSTNALPELSWSLPNLSEVLTQMGVSKGAASAQFGPITNITQVPESS